MLVVVVGVGLQLTCLVGGGGGGVDLQLTWLVGGGWWSLADLSGGGWGGWWSSADLAGGGRGGGRGGVVLVFS